MTRTGTDRARYSAEVEPRPSRFTTPALYRAWALRADAWAIHQYYLAASRGDAEAARMLPMSEWAEARRDLMTPQTIAANYRLDSADPMPWVSRLTGERRESWDAFSENIATHGLDWFGRYNVKGEGA